MAIWTSPLRPGFPARRAHPRPPEAGTGCEPLEPGSPCGPPPCARLSWPRAGRADPRLSGPGCCCAADCSPAPPGARGPGPPGRSSASGQPGELRICSIESAPRTRSMARSSASRSPQAVILRRVEADTRPNLFSRSLSNAWRSYSSSPSSLPSPGCNGVQLLNPSRGRAVPEESGRLVRGQCGSIPNEEALLLPRRSGSASRSIAGCWCERRGAAIAHRAHAA